MEFSHHIWLKHNLDYTQMKFGRSNFLPVKS
jgi:hypothetical protein